MQRSGFPNAHGSLALSLTSGRYNVTLPACLINWILEGLVRTQREGLRSKGKILFVLSLRCYDSHEMGKEKVLIVDDDQMIRWTLNEALRNRGYTCVEAGTVAAALATVDTEQPAAVLLDVNLPDGSGLDCLREVKRRQPDAIIIMMTGNVLVADTIAALRGGAYDFVGKPINLEELQITIRNGIEAQSLRRAVRLIRRERARQFSFDQIVGESPGLREVFALARKVAESEVSSVLLQGESGTGKDMVAKAIHYGSRRSDLPFIAINCAAIPANLIESELFGYEKGAFTDAKARKEGLFEQAEGGSLFLDEIGELELSVQAKLLRVLEEGSFRRVGGLRDLPLDVRVIASSNRDLKTDSEAGRFRLDLYYRLSVIQIDIPPLRERDNDVILLAEHYIAQFNERLRKRVRGFTPDVAETFRQYPWPGNVRELRNVIERVMILEDGDLITTTYLPRGIGKEGSDTGHESAAEWATRHGTEQGDQDRPETPPSSVLPFRLPPDGLVLDELEMSLVRQALERSNGNQTRAAELLGISRDQLRYRLKKLDDASAG
jgi:two-component system response regulator AtoC